MTSKMYNVIFDYADVISANHTNGGITDGELSVEPAVLATAFQATVLKALMLCR